MINISLNGNSDSIQCDNLAAAMSTWHYALEHCAVAINGEFIPRAQYAETTLHNGDNVDVVGAVGGG